MHNDLCNIENPKISVVTPSLNHGRFLKSTIDSILNQTYRNFEHIVIDGGSTDNTVEILKAHPHIRWVSGPDGGILEALRKGFEMARGEYIIQCCVSDGFVDRDWFSKCVEVLDTDPEIAIVWGLPVYTTESGDLLQLLYQDLLNDPPAQKKEFLSMWFANGFTLPEGNYCVRSDILRRCTPTSQSEKHFQIQPHLGIMFEFMVQGYLPHFLPTIAHYFRAHHDQRSQRLAGEERPAALKYFESIKNYRKKLMAGTVSHHFRDGQSNIIRTLSNRDLPSLRRQIWRQRILRSRWLRRDLFSVGLKIKRMFGL